MIHLLLPGNELTVMVASKAALEGNGAMEISVRIKSYISAGNSVIGFNFSKLSGW